MIQQTEPDIYKCSSDYLFEDIYLIIGLFKA